MTIQDQYNNTIDFLFNQLPVFEKTGNSAYKPGLETVRQLSEMFGSPHCKLQGVIHVAGTNGKGSTTHTIAAILQSAGYRVGLFTSPHLIDFRERIRVNGEMIPKQSVIDFVKHFQEINTSLNPSFFELSTIMAFDHFVKENVDIAVVEVGLGGRLDSTNIITPDLSIITNISRDHTSLLGDTLEEIASEKAGIIKPGIPIIIGENINNRVVDVFRQKAHAYNSPIIFAEQEPEIRSFMRNGSTLEYDTLHFGRIISSLNGACQVHNANTILVALSAFMTKKWEIPITAIRDGFRNVEKLTGLAGRWMKLNEQPLTICDTGHNPGGWQYLCRQIAEQHGKKHIIIGFVADKDVTSILKLLAESNSEATFYFTAPHSHRRLDESALRKLATEHGLYGDSFNDVRDAYKKALADADKGDFIFIGGSNYVISELLSPQQIQ